MLLTLISSTVLLFNTLTLIQGQSASPPEKHIGDLFIFDPGQGACGFTNTSKQLVASVSEKTFNKFPGATKNPNENPICHHNLSITHEGKTVVAPIVDFYTGPAKDNVGLSLPGFTMFASKDKGIVKNVTWSIL